MGSKRFYEHAQNLLGGMKGEVDKLTLGGTWDYTVLYYNGLHFKNCNIML